MKTPNRPPRLQVIVASAALLFLLNCIPSTARKADTLRTHITANLFSTELLAFGADPRSVTAVRNVTTEEDIPALIYLLGDSSRPVAQVAKYALVSYDKKAIPYLNEAIAMHPVMPGEQETLDLIRKRVTR